MELHEGMTALAKAITAPRQPIIRHASCEVKEIGGLWRAEIDFSLFGEDLNEDGVSLLVVTLNGVEVDHSQLSQAACDELVWACLESQR